MRGRVVINDGTVTGPTWGLKPQPGTQFAGVGRRSPVMQNGQVPGIRRQYDKSYALVLQEQQGPYVAMLFGEGRNKRSDFRDAIRTAMEQHR